jgi:DNA uptake protein ComE-like DNA-binding protein
MQEIPWQWQALGFLVGALIVCTVISESAVGYRHPSEHADASRIDINHATQEDLESLPGIGPALARSIIAGRPFSSAEEVARVRGIGPALGARLRPLIKALPGRRTADLR